MRVAGNRVVANQGVAVKSGDSIELGRSMMRFETADEVVDAAVYEEPEEVASRSDSEPMDSPDAQEPRSSLLASSSSPFRIDFVSNGDPFALADSKSFLATIRDELDACIGCLLYTSPSPRDQRGSRMPSSA